MQTISLDGHLGRDAVVRTNSKGMNFVEFSVANTTYIGGNAETQWFDVAIYQGISPERLKLLKKGAYVFLTGVPKFTAYVKKDGTLEVGKRIFVDRWELLGGNRRDENAQGQVNEGAAPQASYQPTYQPAAAPQPAPAPQAAPQAVYQPAPQPQYQPAQAAAPQATAPDDDLPF